MDRIKILYIIVMSLSACGSSEPAPKVSVALKPDSGLKTEDKLQTIKTNYAKVMSIFGISVSYNALPIIIKPFPPEPDGKIMGMCYYSKLGNTVQLDPDFDAYIFFHEMGHCLFNLDDTENSGDIMYYAYFPQWSKITQENLKGYINQIKTQSSSLLKNVSSSTP